MASHSAREDGLGRLMSTMMRYEAHNRRRQHTGTVMDDFNTSETIAPAISMVVELARTSQMITTNLCNLAELLVNEFQEEQVDRPRQRRRVSTEDGQASRSGTQNAHHCGDGVQTRLHQVLEIWYRDGLAEQFERELQRRGVSTGGAQASRSDTQEARRPSAAPQSLEEYLQVREVQEFLSDAEGSYVSQFRRVLEPIGEQEIGEWRQGPIGALRRNPAHGYQG